MLPAAEAPTPPPAAAPHALPATRIVAILKAVRAGLGAAGCLARAATAASGGILRAAGPATARPALYMGAPRPGRAGAPPG